MFNGYKTKIAGISGILGGLSTIALAWSANPIDLHMAGVGLTAVIASLATLGLGGKLQKIIDALGQLKAK